MELVLDRKLKIGIITIHRRTEPAVGPWLPSINERGPRLTEAIPLLRKLWSGEPASHQGRFYGVFEGVPMQPPARPPGGPPIWCGGRSDGALRRAGQLADGWIAYVVTPEMYKAGLDKIAQAATEAGRAEAEFGTGHLLFTRLDATYEKALDAA